MIYIKYNIFAPLQDLKVCGFERYGYHVTD